MPVGIRVAMETGEPRRKHRNRRGGGVSVHINRVYVNICFGLCMPKPNRTPYTPAASQNKPPKWGFCRLFIPYLYPIKQERLIIKRLTAILCTQSRDRTGMEVNPLVFETSASTNSAIWAYLRSGLICGAKLKLFSDNAKNFPHKYVPFVQKTLYSADNIHFTGTINRTCASTVKIKSKSAAVKGCLFRCARRCALSWHLPYWFQARSQNAC